jgi:hypothetical protein
MNKLHAMPPDPRQLPLLPQPPNWLNHSMYEAYLQGYERGYENGYKNATEIAHRTSHEPNASTPDGS